VSKTIRIRLSPESIGAAIEEVRAYKKWVQDKANELVLRLAEKGVDIASVKFAAAEYNGTKYVSVNLEESGGSHCAVVATGKTVLILEFGAGVIGEGHELAGEFGYGPGTYPGQTHVPNPGYWWFTGDDKQLHFSRGNPPSMAMFSTAKDLRGMIEETAREVFAS